MMWKQPEQSEVQNPEPSRKWALARRIGGVGVAVCLAGVSGWALAYNEKVIPRVIDVIAPDMEITPSDPLVASLAGAEPEQPEAPVLNEFALFSDEQTAFIGAKPMPTDLPIY